MYQRKYYDLSARVAKIVGVGETHLARADFVESHEGECLC